jgi:hypothetical protein
MRRSARVVSWSWFFMLALTLLASRAEAQRPIPVNIESTPPGAQVFLDVPTGAPICTTPCSAVRVAGGNHTLFFKLERYSDAQAQVNVRRRRETFRGTLNPVSTISITAGNDSSSGAAIRIDGVPVGNVPFSASVSPGRHMVQVGREGFVTFSQWVDLGPAQGLQLPVALDREAPQTGSLLVAADVSGAEVRVDGESQLRATTPAFIENLAPGMHSIEVRAAGLPPKTETVMIQTGQRAVLNLTLRPAAPTGGTLRILANAPGARISVDGELLGESPATKTNIAPGEHIVEAVAEGYERLMQTVTTEAGAQRVVSLEMRPQSLPPGRIVVNANVAAAHVTIDGEDRGEAPIVIENAAGGGHAIVVAAQGYEDFRTTCEIRAGQNCTVDARLVPVGTPVLVTANVEGAELVIDGRPMGPTPYEGNLPVGAHQIEVRLEGHTSFVAQIDLTASAERREIPATLHRVGDEEREANRVADAQRRMLERRTAMITAAGPLPPELFVVGLSLGWPYIAEMRLGVGLTDYLEAGFTIRSMFGRATEFEGRVELSRRFAPQVAAGVAARLGGGIGPTYDGACPASSATCTASTVKVAYPINTFSFSLEALFSLYFGQGASVTLWGALDYYSDQYGWEERHGDVALPIPRGSDLPDRNSAARFRIGGAMEFVLSRNWNAFGQLDGILGDGNGTEPNPDDPAVRRGTGRRMFGDWGLFTADPELYLRLGVTYKF